MRFFERQPEEKPRHYAAFALYRDLGAGRSLRTVAEALYGVRWKYGKRTVEKWSSRFDWVARAGAYDDWRELERRSAVEEHETKIAADYAGRRQELRRLNIENEERAANQTSRILDELERTPLKTLRVSRTDNDGKPVEYIVESGVGPLDLAASRLHRLAKASEPTKVAPTDPTGEHEHGKSSEEIDREFEEAFATRDTGFGPTDEDHHEREPGGDCG